MVEGMLSLFQRRLLLLPLLCPLLRHLPGSSECHTLGLRLGGHHGKQRLGHGWRRRVGAEGTLQQLGDKGNEPEHPEMWVVHSTHHG